MNKDWYWTDAEETALMKAKEMLKKENQLTSTDFDKLFHVYTGDVSDRKLGATVV